MIEVSCEDESPSENIPPLKGKKPFLISYSYSIWADNVIGIKNRIKNRRYWTTYLKNRLYIAAFILALVGWFILFVYLFGPFFEKELLALEVTIESPLFTWGLRIFIIALAIILIKGKERIQIFFAHRSIQWVIYLILSVGAVEWLAWFISLFL